jgi:phosphatidylglycerol lysyltransferase
MLTLTYKKATSFIKKLHWKELLAVFFILVAFYFFRQERRELQSVGSSLSNANGLWVTIGLVFTIGYVLLQAGLYVYSFSSVKGSISLIHAVELFLKRNLISVFLPAGGISALAYLPKNIRKSQVNKHQVHQASAIYGFIGIFSVFIVAIPVLLYLAVKNASIPGATTGLVSIILILGAIVFLVRAIRSKGKVYQWLIKDRPKIEARINEIFSFELSMPEFWKATFDSVLIEVVGIVHLYIAMLAVGVQPSLEAAIVGYIVATIFLIISPFLRGVGAIEVSLTYILHRYGYTPLQAFEITILFRLFEFWLPLVFSIFSYAAKGRGIFLRLLPPVMIFLLGLVNILSVLTPPIVSRLRLLQGYIPMSSIQASNFLVIVMGITLIATANFLIRGLRTAWLLALSLSIISCFAHLTKALDYEEAILSLIVSVILLATWKQYRLKGNPRLMNIGIVTALATFLAALVFGTIGFYYLDVRHFGFDFTWKQSLTYAFKTFVLVEEGDLKPITHFGHDFLFFIKALGVAAWLFLFYCIIRPRVYKASNTEEKLEKAKYLLTQYGDSPLDYFKISADKTLFVSETYDGFMAYRVVNNFAIALEGPVCAEDNKVVLIRGFEAYCRKKGIKPVYYRVDEESLYYFEALKKRKVFIGQEAILELGKFTLEGKDRKSLRNGLNSLSKKGYKVQRHKAPLPGSLLQALQQVSDEWLDDYEMEEVVFSQGMFDRHEIKNHDVITIEDSEARVVGFLNIIPDYSPGEITYDLIRKTADAPGGCMDALIIELIQYAKSKDLQFLNLGMVPMSGIETPDNPAEQVVKFAYERMKRFSNYKGLRDFKEKYATEWLNKYLVYENDFDLVQLPTALNKAMQPLQK